MKINNLVPITQGPAWVLIHTASSPKVGGEEVRFLWLNPEQVAREYSKQCDYALRERQL